MAFQMIHMEIAYRLLERMPQITDPARFILGSVAPDSVHMNPDYNIDMKIKSHMFQGCGPWSDTQDYPLWEKNIQSFYEVIAGREQGDRDFGIGICVHCLTDYWNDRKIWRSLQHKYIPPMSLEEFRESYYPEARGIDQWLYQNSKNTQQIRELLSEAPVMEIERMITKEDVERQKYHLLNIQYDVAGIDISKYRYLSASSIEDFIEFTVNAIEETISGWANPVTIHSFAAHSNVMHTK